MNTKQKLYLKKVKNKGRLLTDEEAFDFYTKHIMRNQASCKWSPWAKKGKGSHYDYPLWELETKAKQWHKLMVGSLVLSGTLVTHEDNLWVGEGRVMSSDKMSCMQCGWKGSSGELESAMGFDEMCPYCGSFTEDLSGYIPPTRIRATKRVLYLIVTCFWFKKGMLYWKFNGAIKRIGT